MVVVVDFDDVVDAAVSLASALASVAWADANDAWVDSTLALRWATSREARVCPAVTVWPTAASTALTVPETLKARLACSTGAMVPTESRVAVTVPVPTTDVRYVADAPRVRSQATSAATRRTTTTPTRRGENQPGPVGLRLSPVCTAAATVTSANRAPPSGGGGSSAPGDAGSSTGGASRHRAAAASGAAESGGASIGTRRGDGD